MEVRMFKWINNRVIALAIILAFGMWLPAGMAMAGGHYYGGYGHHGYGHHYGYGHGYGHHYGGHEHGHHSGYGHHYAYYGLGAYALYDLFGHYDDYGYGHHYYYGDHYYTPYYGYSSYPYSYGYPSYSHENHAYSHQEDARISHNRDGWQLLKDNHPNDALNAFAIEAQNHPTKGMPKVGYALASAETGQLDRGVWAMRRALRFDPESLHYIAMDQPLKTKIRALIHRYDYNSTSAKSTDAAFMRASLHYLIRESTEAKHAMDQMVQAHDDAISTRNLKKLIHETL